VLSHEASYALIERFGLPVVPQQLVSSAAEAVEFAERIGFPVVAKLANSEAASHKTELGAILINIATREALAHAVDRLLSLIKDRRLTENGRKIPLLVQKMVRPALEVFLGATVPPGDYPPMVLVGAGGAHVEIMRDIVRGIAPLSESRALALIERLKIYPLLKGFRGGPRYDIATLAGCMVKLGELISATQDHVREIDLNPLLVQPEGKGGCVVDALFALAAGDDHELEPELR
jgi:succinyl-CoA synthetase beta subunit